MKRNGIRITLIGSIVSLLVACNQVGIPTLPDETLPQPTKTSLIDNTPIQESQTDDSQMTQLAPSSNIEAQIEKAKEDLAQRLSVEITRINLIEAREVVWPDTSIGCPQKDMTYTQVSVNGLLITLSVGKEVYFYHSSRTGDPFLCENTSPGFTKSTPKPDEFVPPPDWNIE